MYSQALRFVHDKGEWESCDALTQYYPNNPHNLILDNNVKECGQVLTAVLEGQGLYFEDPYRIEYHYEIN